MGRSSLFLIGFMGAGKSSLGKRLAELMHREFCDLDQEIVRSSSCAIPTLFRELGEAGFRRLESQALQATPSQAVIAVGGGCWQQPQNRRMVSRKGHAVFLDWPFDVLLQRIQGDWRRPLAKDPLFLYSLFCLRRPVFLLADIVVPLTALESGHAQRTARSVLEGVRAAGAAGPLAEGTAVDKNSGGL